MSTVPESHISYVLLCNKHKSMNSNDQCFPNINSTCYLQYISNQQKHGCMIDNTILYRNVYLVPIACLLSFPSPNLDMRERSIDDGGNELQ